MAFCNMCGTQIPDSNTTCPACASRMAAAAPVPGGPAPGVAAPAPAATSDNLVGMIAYFTIFPAIILLLIDPYNKSRFVRFHAFQSIFFGVGWICLWIVLRIVLHIPFFGWLTFFLWPLVWLAGFIVWVILVIKANQGQMYKLPVIGDMAEKQANAM
jgi:uncharacterized membrane protein